MNPSEDLAARVVAMGARFDPEIARATRELFRPAVARLPFAARPVIADLHYGPDPRHRLDVYPADAVDATDTGRAPVVVFVHGGGFTGGDKAADPVFYGNVGRFFAASGFTAVLVNYRLAPGHVVPAGGEDVGRALAWVAERIGAHGGDGSTVSVVGQSAGAAHVAQLLFDPRLADLRQSLAPRVSRVALLSGFYRPHAHMPPGAVAYYGSDLRTWSRDGALGHVSREHPELLVTVAELDPPDIAEQTTDLVTALTRVDGRAPRFACLERHNHVSPVHGLGLAGDRVGPLLLAFLRG